MWKIEEYRRVDKQLAGSVPVEVLKRYEKWKDIARISGPQGLRAIKGFRDEALSGEWKSHRSSRLVLQWRVIYTVAANVLQIQVVHVTATITGGHEMKEFSPAKKRVEVSVGESVRIVRELQELTQSKLSELTGIPQATISAIENGRVNLGVERAKVLARALNCHPAVLVFPGWEVPLDRAA